jgi:hypothetical protein
VNDIPANRLGNQTGGAASNQATHQAVLGDTYSFSPTLIMESNLSFTRAYYDDNPPSVGFDLSQFGPAWATLNNQVTFRELPTPAVSGGMYGFGGMNVTSRHYRNAHALSSNLTKVSGQHQIKFGGEIRLMGYNFGQSTNPSGNFSFNQAFTSFDGTQSATTGVPFASFMLGYPSSGSLTTIQMATQYMWYQGYYVGDTFQLNRKLTLTYGVRWELPGAYAEKHDAATILLPFKSDPLSSSAGMTLKGQLGFVNSTDWPNRTAQQVRHDRFAPRVGFAYRVTNSTVVRAGYGISCLAPDLSGTSPSQSPVLSASTSYVATGTNIYIPLNTLSSPFPSGGVPGTTQQSILRPAGRNYNLANLEGTSISGPIVDEPYGYVQQWNLNIQHELKAGLMFEIGYAGSKGLHLPAGGIQLNQLNPSYFSQGAALLTAVTNPMAGLFTNPSASALNGKTIRAGQLLRPYPQFSGVSNSAGRIGVSSYNSMQVRMEKRFGAAGIITGNYTWAKFMGDVDSNMSYLEKNTQGSYQDYTNLKGEWSLTSFDVPHRAVISYVLELPFGKGKKLAGGVSGPLGKLISGWSANGILNFQSGYPLALKAPSNNLSSFGVGGIRPNRVAGCNPVIEGSAQSRVAQWFNTACFAQPGLYSFGNEGRTDPVLRTHGVNNVDFTLAKTTTITEKVKLQFKTEFYNLFNRVQFQVNNTTMLNNFGVVTAQQNQPRLIQFALRLTF